MVFENVSTYCLQNDSKESSTLDLLLGGQKTRIHFASKRLREAFAPALEHLTSPASTPESEIFFCEAKETLYQLPLFSDIDSLGPHGSIPNLPPPCSGALQPVSGVLSLYDSHNRQGFVVVRDVDALPNFELAAPLRLMLGWLAANSNFSLAHAAAIANSEGAALLVGRGGSGKSTTSLACLLNGFDFLGDDYVALTDQPLPTVWSLYRSAKVARPSLELHPTLNQFVKRGPTSEFDDKYLLDIGALSKQINNGRGVIASAPLKAIILPRVTSESQTRILPTSAMAALRALAPSTVFQQSGFGAIALERLTQLARRIPAYELLLGTDGKAPEQIASALSKQISNE
jgi:hypothetical protein